MATFQSVEEIEAWKSARKLVQKIYAISNQGDFAKDYGLRDQIRRASVSIMSNIAEGYERSGNSEFVHFLSMAKGSTGEVKTQLYVALDQAYISENIFSELAALADETARKLGGLMNYLRDSDIRGAKFK